MKCGIFVEQMSRYKVSIGTVPQDVRELVNCM